MPAIDSTVLPGVKVQREDTYTRYMGKPAALLAAGLLSAEQVPGRPPYPWRAIKWERDGHRFVARKAGKHSIELVVYLPEEKCEQVRNLKIELAQCQRRIDALPKSAEDFRKMTQHHAFGFFAAAWLHARDGRGGYRLSAGAAAALQEKLHEAEAIIEDARIVLDPAARASELALLRAPAVEADPAFQAFLASTKAAAA